MSKGFFSFFQAATSTSGQPMLDDPMLYSYHHGLCPQGRIALGIDAAHTRRLRQAKVLDAIAVGLWGASLLGLMWLL